MGLVFFSLRRCTPPPLVSKYQRRLNKPGDAYPKRVRDPTVGASQFSGFPRWSPSCLHLWAAGHSTMLVGKCHLFLFVIFWWP